MSQPQKPVRGGHSIGEALLLEKLDKDLYRSINLWKPFPKARAVYGGQLIGQTLVAAHRSQERKDLSVHSMHAYFLLPGNATIPALYHVDRIRDGRSFSTRSIVARQNGAAIMSAQASFHKTEQTLLDHFTDMPTGIIPPEEALTRKQCVERLYKRTTDDSTKKQIKYVLDAMAASPAPPVETRFMTEEDGYALQPFSTRKAKAPRHCIWFKSSSPLPDRPWAHDCVAAYASDLENPVTAALPLGYPNQTYNFIASLDHSMWFHTTFRADEWMLYVMESHRAGGGRGLVQGRMYRRDGVLAVSVTQEVLMRLRPPPEIEPKQKPDKVAKL